MTISKRVSWFSAMAWELLLSAILMLCGKCEAGPRTNVVIRGTTVGPDWVSPKSGQCKAIHWSLFSSEIDNYFPLIVSIVCPSSHKYITNGGLTCCSKLAHSDNISRLIGYNDPKEKCEDSWDCPDPSRKCRQSYELPGL